jgi:hypothetical protein
MTFSWGRPRRNVMNASNRNVAIGIGAALLVAIVLYFFLSPPATVGSVPEPAATGQTK